MNNNKYVCDFYDNDFLTKKLNTISNSGFVS